MQNKDFPSITNTHLQQETAFPSKEPVSDNTQQSIEEKESCLILTNSLCLSGDERPCLRYESKVPIRETKTLPVAALGHVAAATKLFVRKRRRVCH